MEINEENKIDTSIIEGCNFKCMDGNSLPK